HFLSSTLCDLIRLHNASPTWLSHALDPRQSTLPFCPRSHIHAYSSKSWMVARLKRGHSSPDFAIASCQPKAIAQGGRESKSIAVAQDAARRLPIAAEHENRCHRFSFRLHCFPATTAALDPPVLPTRRWLPSRK